jgi:hypothetical protein
MRKLAISALAALLMATVVACSGGSESGSSATTNAQLASAAPTPAFRNLGKRGDSDLPPPPQKPM